jgi:HEAT repeat protein
MQIEAIEESKMIERLACKLGRNDEIPNIELAEYLSENGDTAGIKEIVDGLTDKDKAVANDCIKVLYEIGDRKPELISEYANEFISCLYSKNNRLVWGSMTALAKIVHLSSQQIYDRIDEVISAYENGSGILI